MEILFKDDAWIYYIDEQKDRLSWTVITTIGNVDISKVKHLDDAKVLYHYIDEYDNQWLPVYCEYNGRIMTKFTTNYFIVPILDCYTKDYTLTNLNLLEDGDIIQR